MDVATELAPHLNPRDVAVLIEIGSEKLRYLHGDVVAVHPDGRAAWVNLSDIYKEARKAFGDGINMTEAIY